MRGQDTQQAGMFSYLSPEERVPAAHPLRPIRQYVDTALTAREVSSKKWTPSTYDLGAGGVRGNEFRDSRRRRRSESRRCSWFRTRK